MDNFLYQRWSAAQSPFDGNCLHSVDLLSIEELRTIIAIAVAAVTAASGSQSLYELEDWHQHDGFISERKQVLLSSLADVARTDEAVIQASPSDTHVFRAYYSEDCGFLLRFAVSDPDDGDCAGQAGTFDLSAAPAIITQVYNCIPTNLHAKLLIEPAKDYFEQRYGG